MTAKTSWFTHFAQRASRVTGRPAAVAVSLAHRAK